MLEIITSSALSPIKHGFFTRKGGASSGIFSGLNCGIGSSDQAEIVAINRERVADAMEVVPDDLVTIWQTHSADALIMDEPVTGDRPKADGMATKTPGLALSILTADCQPVLFADRTAGVIGAAHAGWRGALGGVLESTIKKMETLGAKRSQIDAVIGPCLSQRNYEVGPEFIDAFLAEDSDNASFFAQGNGDRMLFDLPSFGLHRLRAAGVSATWVGQCTYDDEDRFYSYRRTTHQNQADYGRLISSIRL